MGVAGTTVAAASICGMIYCTSTIKSLIDISCVGLLLGTGQTMLHMLVIIRQWGAGAIINRFPGDSPGVYLNDGFLVAFGVIVPLSFGSIFCADSFRPESEKVR